MKVTSCRIRGARVTRSVRLIADQPPNDVHAALQAPARLVKHDGAIFVTDDKGMHLLRTLELFLPETPSVAGLLAHEPMLGFDIDPKQRIREAGQFVTVTVPTYERNMELVDGIMRDAAEDELRIAKWRQRFTQALGPNGRLIVDLVPQLGLIVGPQPPVPELPLAEADTRLRRVFGRLFAACATPDHPLAMFIDDMQWADTASLALIANLLTDGDTRHLLIIGAYRDNEVDPSHPVVRALEAARRSHARIRDLVFGPLSDDDLGGLVADTVHASPGEAAPLASLVRDKTGGNPFFAIQFLTALHHKRAIWFDREAHRWRWNAARIRAEGYTDNIAELMRSRLYALPGETQAALQRAACIGNTVDAATLAIACEREVAPALRPAIEQHLLFETLHGEQRTYRFPHDRVHEAAYALVPESETSDGWP